MPRMISSQSTTRSRRGGASLGGLSGELSADGRVITLILCEEETFTSTGAASYVSRPVAAVLDGMGPSIEDIVIHALGRVFSANFKYKVTAERSYDGETWTAFSADVLSERTTSGYHVGSAYTTRTDFGRMIRFKIEVSDAGAKEIGTLSISAAIKLWH